MHTIRPLYRPGAPQLAATYQQSEITTATATFDQITAFRWNRRQLDRPVAGDRDRSRNTWTRPDSAWETLNDNLDETFARTLAQER